MAPFLAALALLAAGCGGASKPPAVASLGTTRASGTATNPASSGTPVGSGAPSAGGSSGGGFGFAIAEANGSSGLADEMKLTTCMRSNGVPNFPEPNGQGVIQASGLDPNSPAFQKAMQACRKVLPNGGTPTPAQQAQQKALMLKMSQCMRSHGVPNFPDPTFGSGGRVSLRITAGQGLDPSSPTFQAAQQKCASASGLPTPKLGSGVQVSSAGAANGG